MTTTADPAEKVKRNAEIAGKSWHTWVYWGVSGLVMAVLFVGKDAAIAFLTGYPLLAPLSVLVAPLLTYGAQLLPQTITLSSDIEAMRAQIVGLVLRKLTAGGLSIDAAAPVLAAVPTMKPAELKATLTATEHDDFPPTQRVDVPLEPTPPAVVVTAQLAAAAGPANLLAANRVLAPGLRDDEIVAAVTAQAKLAAVA